MVRKKIKFSKSIKLYLLKQLKKVPGLNLNSLIHPRSLSLTSTCNYPRTQSIDKRNSNVNFITNHESDLSDLNRYILEYFPSVGISDDESSLIDTSTTKQSPAGTGTGTEFSSSTSNSLVVLVPSSPIGDIREGEAAEAGVLVVTLPNNESSSINTSTTQSPANHEEFSSGTSNSLVVPSSATGDNNREGEGEGEAGGVLLVTLLNNESSSIDASTKQSTSNSLVVPSSATGDNIREGEGEGEAGVVVVTFSIDPYKDFKRSMKTMLKADNAGKSQLSNQDNLNELLLCYLEQNNKSMHKHVLRAFNDITNEISDHSHRYEQQNLNGNEAAKGTE